MQEMERILKALANRRRLAIVSLVKKDPDISVTEIAKEIHLSFRSTSKHLAVLTAARVLDKEQKSSQVFYRLASDQKPAAKNILPLL